MSVKKKYIEAFGVESRHPSAAIPLYLEIYRPPPRSLSDYWMVVIAEWMGVVSLVLGLVFAFSEGKGVAGFVEDFIVGFIIFYMCMGLPLMVIAAIYFSLTVKKTVPAPYAYRALATMGLSRCYIMEGKTYEARNYATRLIGYPVESFSRVGGAIISFLDGDINNAIYFMNIARTNPFVPPKVLPDYLAALDRCVALFKSGILLSRRIPTAPPVKRGVPRKSARPAASHSVPQSTGGAGGPRGRAVEEDVRILRETEYVRGYIRLKVAVQNNSPSVITDVNIELIYDGRIFRLERVEPEYEVKGDSVRVPTIGGYEKKTVAFYLDPQICTSSMIDAVISYRDHRGLIHTKPMQKKEVNVACPIFFTKEVANVAMLRNLISGVLSHQDSRIYTIPKGISPARAFDIARDVMSGRDVVYVREYCEESPYRAEAWYYGETKVKGYKIVVKVGVEKEEDVIVLFAAASNEEVLTGLLAEMGHELRERLAKEGKPTTQITNVLIKDSVLHKSNLLFSDKDSSAGRIEIQDSVVNRSEFEF